VNAKDVFQGALARTRAYTRGGKYIRVLAVEILKKILEEELCSSRSSVLPESTKDYPLDTFYSTLFYVQPQAQAIACLKP